MAAIKTAVKAAPVEEDEDVDGDFGDEAIVEEGTVTAEPESKKQEEGQVGEAMEEIVETQEVPSVATIFIFSANCIRCSHFTTVLSNVRLKGQKKPIQVKPFSNCHWSKGNDACPARELRMVIGVNARSYARKMIETAMARDTDGLAELEAKLTRYDEEVQQQVYDAKEQLVFEDSVADMLASGVEVGYEAAAQMAARKGLLSLSGDEEKQNIEITVWFDEMCQRLGINIPQ
jgi:hypothetical protein